GYFMERSWQEALRSLIAGRVLFNESLRNHTSMGVGGPADALVYPAGAEELGQLLKFLRDRGLPSFILGNGTNVICRDGGFRGIVISLADLAVLQVVQDMGEKVLIRAEAGAGLGRLVDFTLRDSLTGMEFLAGIPGAVGGALRMNAGAYGREIKDCTDSLEIMDGSGVTQRIGRAGLHFDYRNLLLPAGAVILAGSFFLEKGESGGIKARISEILAARKERHPLNFRNAGSIFKNPSGQPAGQIVDRLGLKGLKVGDAQISPLHGNFIVNLGQASARDIIDLIGQVKETVRTKAGICLEEEVKIIGDDS
ncbi:MAG: UDP-N-acetylmuramate dehydrogenase, partial [Smithellaceae bacterium]|nr:UDP-N-acetylmuramate dehydrogenase [Smithellaceae bacterium]